MIGFLLADLVLKPLEEKESLIAGQDYFFLVEGQEDKKYTKEYLEETFYVVSDFEKDGSRYFHVVYLGQFKQALKHQESLITVKNLEESQIKTKDIKRFIYFRFFHLGFWVQILLGLFSLLIGFLVFNFFRKKFLFLRESKKVKKEFSQFSTRDDFESLLRRRSYYEFYLKKDLADLIQLIKTKQYHPHWDEEFLFLCKKELKNYV